MTTTDKIKMIDSTIEAFEASLIKEFGQKTTDDSDVLFELYFGIKPTMNALIRMDLDEAVKLVIAAGGADKLTVQQRSDLIDNFLEVPF